MKNLRSCLHTAFSTSIVQSPSNLRLLFGTCTIAVATSGIALAQTQAKVTVNLGKELNILTSTSIGAPAGLYDGGAFSTATAPYLKAAGIYTVRFPGSSAAPDLFHWSTNNLSKYKGIDPGYRAPESNFANLAQVADKTGTAMIVVNYGTNEAGTGGGEPVEAAAWVAYANGDPSNTTALGKDSSGKDWQTVGYWATMRTQAPLATDDGYNFLRISRPGAMKIKLWQVGSQVYNNGYYGSGKDHVGEPDLHGPAPGGLNDFGKLKKNPKLSPAAYGDGIVEFAKAMKAVDPTIEIGASLATPPDMMNWAPDWNPSVLKRACKDLDFVTLEWTMGTVLPPDYKTLDEDNLLGGARGALNGIFTGVLYDYKNSCPAGHTPRIAFEPAAAINWAKVTQPMSVGLWAADTYALLVESGRLKRACKDLDFVTLEWTMGTVLPPDYKTLDEDNLLGGARGALNGIFTGVLYDYKNNCPAGHTPRIAFEPAAAINWAKVTQPMSVGLWAADTYALLVESGSQNVSWSDMFGDAMISQDRKKFGPVYYSLQMLHIVARTPGDVLVDAASSAPKLAVHATKRRDGATGIMLVNKDSSGAFTAKISITGGTVGTKAKRFDYGLTQQKAGAPLVSADFPGAGGEFTVTVPPYSITDIVITP